MGRGVGASPQAHLEEPAAGLLADLGWMLRIDDLRHHERGDAGAIVRVGLDEPPVDGVPEGRDIAIGAGGLDLEPRPIDADVARDLRTASYGRREPVDLGDGRPVGRPDAPGRPLDGDGRGRGQAQPEPARPEVRRVDQVAAAHRRSVGRAGRLLDRAPKDAATEGAGVMIGSAAHDRTTPTPPRPTPNRGPPMTTDQRAPDGRDRRPTTARMVIGGESVDAADGQTFEVVNPATGKVIATAPLGGREDVDRAVAAAQKAFDDRKGWANWAAGKRGRTLAKFADLIKKNSEELAWLESRNVGKPITGPAARSSARASSSTTTPAPRTRSSARRSRSRSPASTSRSASRSASSG